MQKPLPLERTILNGFSFSKLAKLCYESKYSTVLDCEWDVWRQRALDLHNIPKAYFDLAIGKYPGIERYIEVITQQKLNINSGIDIYGEEFVGVYEEMALIEEVIKRNNWKILPCYLKNISEKVKAYIREEFPKDFTNVSSNLDIFCFSASSVELVNILDINIQEQHAELCPKVNNIEKHSGETFSTEELSEFPLSFISYLIRHGNKSVLHISLEEDFYSSLAEFYNIVLYPALESGRIDFTELMLSYYDFPEEFSINNYVPFDPNQTEFPLIELPFSFPYDRTIFESVILGGNIQIIDFFRSLYNINIISTENTGLDVDWCITESYFRHHDSVATYSLMQRSELSFHSFSIEKYSRTGNSDIISYFFTQLKENHPSNIKRALREFLEHNYGNYVLYQTVLPWFDLLLVKKATKILMDINRLVPEVYPLTKELINDYLENRKK